MTIRVVLCSAPYGKIACGSDALDGEVFRERRHFVIAFNELKRPFYAFGLGYLEHSLAV